MGILKKWGLVTDDGKDESVKEPPQKPEKYVMDKITTTPPSFIDPNIKPTTDYLSHLNDIMKRENLQGPDYLEFSEALSKMEGKPLTEEQKYENINLTFEAMGVPPAKLISSAQHYLKAFENEKNSFETELRASKDRGITQKNKQISEDESALKKLSEKIQAAKLEVEQNTQKLAVEESSFNIAYSQKVNTINNHIINIQNYLVNGNAKS